MPELPEVETVRRGLAPAMVGARFDHVLQRRPDLRFPFPDGFVRRLEGRRLITLVRRAKYLIGEIEGGERLLMHLGMSGRFTVENAMESPLSPGRFHHDAEHASKHDHIVFMPISLVPAQSAAT